MKYDFDTITDRRNTGSLKWDVKDNELPMWVADMDFQTAPEIREALSKRFEHGVFGYSIIPSEWESAYISWWKRRHNLDIDASQLTFCTGVIPAISTTVRRFTVPNENVLVMTPVYNMFFNSIVNNGRRPLECPLSYDGVSYSINWEDLEAKLSDPQTSLMILCNPHNPIGHAWDRETLERIGELCWKHNVLVLSDEIHCDLTDPGVMYTPFATVSEHCRDNSITCLAPTKTFNIAGLQTAAVMVPNKSIHHKLWRALNTDEVAEPNAFAITAAIAAFEHGEAWLDELRDYIFENKRTVLSYFEKNIPQIHITPSDSTYLLWLDCSKVTNDTTALTEMIREKTGLYLSAGEHFRGNGKTFIRFNIACPRATLLDGLDRLKRALN